MSYELPPILLDESFDEWICENLMYSPPISSPYNLYQEPGKYYESSKSLKIKDSGKKGSERIYQALREIERIKGIKL